MKATTKIAILCDRVMTGCTVTLKGPYGEQRIYSTTTGKITGACRYDPNDDFVRMGGCDRWTYLDLRHYLESHYDEIITEVE